MSPEAIVAVCGVLTVLITQMAAIRLAMLNKRSSADNSKAIQEVKVATDDAKLAAEATKDVIKEVKQTGEDTQTMMNGRQQALIREIASLKEQLGAAKAEIKILKGES